MAIKFRCPYCRQLLGISTTKAGTVVDCPACGRSINVPGEGGFGGKPPQSQHPSNHPELLDALQELSALGRPELQQGLPTSASITSNPVPRARKPPIIKAPTGPPESDASADRDVMRIIPLASAQNAPLASPQPEDTFSTSPIAEENEPFEPDSELIDENVRIDEETAPLDVIPARPADSTFDDLQRYSESPENPDGLFSALTELAATVAPERGTDDSLVEMKSNRTQRGSLIPLMLILPAFALGLLLGTFWQSNEPATSQEKELKANDAAAKAEAPMAVGHRPLSGVVQWTDDSGKSNPDAGALIILLPAENPTRLRFDGRPLREPAQSKARQAIEAALQSLGASIQQTDSFGAWSARMPAESSIIMIVVSQHRSRGNGPPTREITNTLSQWFETPLHVIGQLAVQQQTISPTAVDADPTSATFDVDFNARN